MNPKKYNQSLNKNQLLKIKYRALLVGLTPELFSRIHNRSVIRVYDALRGEAPHLLRKIIKTIERYEKKLRARNEK